MKILIGTPHHGGSVFADYAHSLVRTMLALHENGIEPGLFLRQSSVLPDNRNMIAATALELDCSHLLFIDADMGWEPEAVLQLLAHGVDLVGGIYQMRVTGGAHCLANPRRSDRPNLLEVDAVGTGFLLISRAVLEAMTAAWGCHGLFQFAVDERGHINEDLTFCGKARGLGFKVHADPLMRLRHHGAQVFDMTWLEAHQLGRPVAIRSMPVIPPPADGSTGAEGAAPLVASQSSGGLVASESPIGACCDFASGR